MYPLTMRTTPPIRAVVVAGLLVLAPVVAGAGESPLPADDSSRSVEDAVVKVFSATRRPDLGKPWAKQSPTDVTGSGVIIEGKRILTNAHVVLYASQVQVQANRAGDKVGASVQAIAPGIDLALLKLDDESLFDAHRALPRAKDLPAVSDVVLAYGYPEGGSSLSITKGIVSRIEFAHYNPYVHGLRIQIDAAINPGNSGGAAVAGCEMIGLTFSRLGGADNIGYIIPNQEIELFLKDVADGKYDGKPEMFDTLQTLENPALRSRLKLADPVQGLVVNEPDSSDPTYPLKKWDVITAIGETRIDDQGMIKLGANLRLSFRYLIQTLARNGTVPLTVVRDGRSVNVELPVRPRQDLVIPSLEGGYPSYFIWGPVVFSEATTEYIASLKPSSSGGGRELASMLIGSPLFTRPLDKSAFPGERLVVVSSPFFPHRLAAGYSSAAAHVVKTIDGQPIKNLAHLVEVLRDGREEFVTIEFDCHNCETIVLPRQAAVAATEGILNDNGIRSQGSPDALAIWNAKSAR